MPSSVTEGALLKIRNPANHEVLAEIPQDNPNTIGKKFVAAKAAQPQWATTTFQERKACITRFRDLLTSHQRSLAETLTREVGKPITQAEAEVGNTLPRVDYFLENIEEMNTATSVRKNEKVTEALAYEPLGVVANISAWNYPYFVSTNVLIPALLTGNAVLYKPSEFATMTGAKIVELLHQSGIPPEICPIIIGDGQVGGWVLDEAIDGCFFTGSHKTGTAVAMACAKKLIRCQLELGGKDPAYVRADANIAHACESLAEGAFYNAGQSCCAVERIYVHEDIAEPFTEGFLSQVHQLKTGDPFKEDCTLGPLTRTAQVPLLERQVADALEKGAHKLIGGGRMGEQGNYFAATVLTEVNHSMDVMREESFGPIIGIQVVKSDEEALELMRDTHYGLTASVFTQDVEVGKALLAKVDCGSAYLNCCDRVSPHLPWSGRGDSGIGSTLGSEGIRAFVQPKAWHIRL